MSLRGWIVLSCVASLILGVVGAGGYLAWRQRFWFPVPSADVSGTPAALRSYYTQKLTWTYCGKGAHCTRVVVPIDYAKPDGPTLTLAVRVYPSTGSHYLFVNPGGPGASAQDFATAMRSIVGASVRRRYAIVGVDPRGVGKSTPLSCLSAKQFDEFTAADPDPNTPVEVAEYRRDTRRLGQACEKNSGLLAAHVSTEEAARDHDIVRALLGQPKLDWYGASYGTILGATYADLFGSRVGRMVLDGAIDSSLTPVEAALGQAQGFQLALDSYIEHCIAKNSCPAKWMSVDEGNAAIADLMRSLDAEPLPGADGRELTQGLALYGIVQPLYSTALWPQLTTALKAAFGGDGGPLVELANAYFDRSSDGRYSDNFGQVIYAVNCLDSPSDATVADVDHYLPRFEAASPVFGRTMAWGVIGCTDWPVPATHPQRQVSGKGAAPIVVVGTTRDPATPYAWAKALAAQLESGVLITRVGDGHTAYNEGNACIDSAIDRYLVDGVVPKNGLVCH